MTETPVVHHVPVWTRVRVGVVLLLVPFVTLYIFSLDTTIFADVDTPELSGQGQVDRKANSFARIASRVGSPPPYAIAIPSFEQTAPDSERKANSFARLSGRVGSPPPYAVAIPSFELTAPDDKEHDQRGNGSEQSESISLQKEIVQHETVEAASQPASLEEKPASTNTKPNGGAGKGWVSAYKELLLNYTQLQNTTQNGTLTSVAHTAGARKQRLIYLCATRKCCGLADRLHGVIALFNLAVVGNMDFKIKQMRGNFMDNLKQGQVSWKIQDSDLDKCDKLLVWTYYANLGDMITQFREFKASGARDLCVQNNQFFDPRNFSLELPANVLFTLQGYDISQYNVDIIYNSFHTLFGGFSDALVDDVRKLKQQLGFHRYKRVIAIHIRDADAEFKYRTTLNDAFYPWFVQCAQQIEKKFGFPSDNTTGWLLASSHAANFSFSSLQHLEPLVAEKSMIVWNTNTTNEIPGHVAKSVGAALATSGYNAFRDILLLSDKCVDVLGRTTGGYANFVGETTKKKMFECGVPEGLITLTAR